MSRRRSKKSRPQKFPPIGGGSPPKPLTQADLDGPEYQQDWTHGCDNCGERPILPATGLCGPCMFGESKTRGGNW